VNSTSSERRVALTGAAATSWLQKRGWAFPGGVGPLQLYADEVRRDGFVVRRQWMSAVTGSWSPIGATVTQLTLVIEGEAMVRFGNHENRLNGGYAVRREQGGAIGFESRTAVAIMQIETTSIRREFASTLDQNQAVFESRPSLREMLASQITSTLNSDIEPSTDEFAYVKLSIEYATMALLVGSNEQRLTLGSSGERQLYQRAVHLISTRATDPGLTLDVIADELSISKSHLQRVFRRAGTTPLRFLSQRRAVVARELLAGRYVSSLEELNSIANRAGFASARVMKDAFRRESD
jgi:AraC-like DNA-binding protein